MEVVKKSWADPIGGRDATDNFPEKLRRLRKALRRWESESFGNIKRKKEEINMEIAELEKKEEMEQITMEESGELRNKGKVLIGILLKEEIMSRQRSRVTID